ncbi:MAG: hypothetical protein KAH72_00900 [Flavobacteriaceae bacterium]|nr:hypothetical protein [Flavobacteriaceae bacterium]
MNFKKYISIYNLLFFSIILLTLSCDNIIFEEDISESNLKILAPVNDASVISGNISFNWESVTDADKYQIQIATPNFANAIQIVLDSTISITSFNKQLLPNNYEWRVRAVNSAFQTSYFTNTLTVTEIEDFTDKEVELLSPMNNLISNQNTQNLSWKSVEGATEYRVQIWQPDVNGTLDHDEVVSITSLEYTFIDGNYTWQVRAQNDTQNTLFFTRKLLVDTVKPNTPSLLSPSDKATESSGNISFSWERDAIAGSIELDSIYVYSDVELKNLVFKDKSANKQYDKDLSANSYYWYVQSFDQAGNQSSNSTTFNFDVN